MFFKLFFSISLLGICISSPPQSLKLNENNVALLAKLQSAHYALVKKSLDTTDSMTELLYFVDDDLKANAEVYFIDMADNKMNQLAPLKDACAENDACLSCFDNEYRMTNVAQNATTTLVAFFNDQKEEYEKSITELRGNLQSGAYLSTVVLEKFRSSKSFETDASNYYKKIQKALIYETDLFSQTITDTVSTLISYNVEQTARATELIQNMFDGMVECADEVMNGIKK